MQAADTWKSSYNTLTFSIGARAGLQTLNYLGSEKLKIEGYRTYTVPAGQNGSFSFTDVKFEDREGNAIVGFSAPYVPTQNVVVDTVLPSISFVDGVSDSPSLSDTITISVDDVNPDVASYRYGFSTDTVCDASDVYRQSFVSGQSFVISDSAHNGQYLCVKAEDMAGNVSYQASAHPLQIVSNVVPVDMVLSKDVIVENSAIGTHIGLFDGGGNTYTLVAGAVDNASFAIISGNVLITKIVPDFETKSSYSVRVKSNNGRGGEFEKTFVIQVTDVEENPPVCGKWIYSPTGSTAHDVVATLTNSTDVESGMFVDGGSCLLTQNNVTCSVIIEDKAGNITTCTSGKVSNIDREKPVIALVGSDMVTIMVGKSYADQGATCQDNVSCVVSVSGSVDAAVVGEYILEYIAEDEAGNRSDVVKRVVRVVPQVIHSLSPITTLPSTGPMTSSVVWIVVIFIVCFLSVVMIVIRR